MEETTARVRVVRLLFGAILLLAVSLRLFQLGQNPPSLYWDEASLGYNAYAIAEYGVDEHNEVYPIIRFIAFGDYKPPGYIYAAAAAIKIFGLSEWSIRLPSALAGLTLVFFSYYLVRELNKSQKTALIVALFVAVSPWDLQLSRAAFEAHLAASLNLAAIYFFLRGRKKSGLNLILASILFAAAYYTFNANRIISPLIFIILGFIWFRELLERKKFFFISTFLMVILILPTVPFLLSKEGKLRFQEVSIFTNLTTLETSNARIAREGNSLTAKLIHNRRLLFLQDFASHFFDHFSGRYLFLTGDRNPRLSIQSVGEFFAFEVILLIPGIVMLRMLERKSILTIVAWGIIALVPGAMARETPHALRTASLLPLGQLLSSLGVTFWIHFFAMQRRLQRILPYFFSVVLSLSLLTYLHAYYLHAPERWSGEWQYGYKQVINYLHKHQQEYQSIVMTRRLGRPYIYLLLYERINPRDYVAKRRAERDWWGLWDVQGYDKYYFDVGYIDKVVHPTLFIGLKGEVPDEALVLETVKSPAGEEIFIIAKL